VKLVDREALPAAFASWAVDYLFYSAGFSSFGLSFVKTTELYPGRM